MSEAMGWRLTRRPALATRQLCLSQMVARHERPVLFWQHNQWQWANAEAVKLFEPPQAVPGGLFFAKRLAPFALYVKTSDWWVPLFLPSQHEPCLGLCPSLWQEASWQDGPCWLQDAKGQLVFRADAGTAFSLTWPERVLARAELAESGLALTSEESQCTMANTEVRSEAQKPMANAEVRSIETHMTMTNAETQSETEKVMACAEGQKATTNAKSRAAGLTTVPVAQQCAESQKATANAKSQAAALTAVSVAQQWSSQELLGSLSLAARLRLQPFLDELWQWPATAQSLREACLLACIRRAYPDKAIVLAADSPMSPPWRRFLQHVGVTLRRPSALSKASWLDVRGVFSPWEQCLPDDKLPALVAALNALSPLIPPAVIKYDET